MLELCKNCALVEGCALQILDLVEKACQGQAAWRGRHDIQHKDIRYNDTQHLRPDLRHMA
jgi:hypothetical protein